MKSRYAKLGGQLATVFAACLLFLGATGLQAQQPDVEWNPADMTYGETFGGNQRGAEFTDPDTGDPVDGEADYTVTFNNSTLRFNADNNQLDGNNEANLQSLGTGSVTLNVTFTPDADEPFTTVSATRNIEISDAVLRVQAPSKNRSYGSQAQNFVNSLSLGSAIDLTQNVTELGSGQFEVQGQITVTGFVFGEAPQDAFGANSGDLQTLPELALPQNVNVDEVNLVDAGNAIGISFITTAEFSDPQAQNYTLAHRDGGLRITKKNLNVSPVRTKAQYGFAHAKKSTIVSRPVGFENGEGANFTPSISAPFVQANGAETAIGEFQMAANLPNNNVSNGTISDLETVRNNNQGGIAELEDALRDFIDNHSGSPIADDIQEIIDANLDVAQMVAAINTLIDADNRYDSSDNPRSAVLANYNLSVFDGTYQVTKRPITIEAFNFGTGNNTFTKVYGADNPNFRARWTIGQGDFSFDLDLDGDGQIENGNGSTEDVQGNVATIPGGILTSSVSISAPPKAAIAGQHDVNIVGGDSQNYAINRKKGTLQVQSRQLNVTAADKTMVQGSTTFPNGSVVFGGFVFDDNPGNTLAQLPEVFLNANAGAFPSADQQPENLAVGNYSEVYQFLQQAQVALNAQGNRNYTVSHNRGALRVVEQRVQFTWDPDVPGITYGDGVTADNVFNANFPRDGGTLEFPDGRITYAVRRVQKPNGDSVGETYTDVVRQEIVGGTLKTEWIAGSTPKFVWDQAASQGTLKAGTYQLRATLDPDKNASESQQTVKSASIRIDAFEVSQRSLTVSARNGKREFGEGNGNIQFKDDGTGINNSNAVTFNGFAPGEDRSFLSQKPALETVGAGHDVGSGIPITFKDNAKSENYSITHNNGELQITKQQPNIGWTLKENVITYGDDLDSRQLTANAKEPDINDVLDGGDLSGTFEYRTSDGDLLARNQSVQNGRLLQFPGEDVVVTFIPDNNNFHKVTSGKPRGNDVSRFVTVNKRVVTIESPTVSAKTFGVKFSSSFSSSGVSFTLGDETFNGTLQVEGSATTDLLANDSIQFKLGLQGNPFLKNRDGDNTDYVVAGAHQIALREKDPNGKLSNYNINRDLNSIVINRKAVTVTADDKRQPKGGNQVPLTIQFSGLVTDVHSPFNGVSLRLDSQSDQTSDRVLYQRRSDDDDLLIEDAIRPSTSRILLPDDFSVNDDVGSEFTITPELSGENYTIAQRNPGTLTIVRKEPNVKFNNLTYGQAINTGNLVDTGALQGELVDDDGNARGQFTFTPSSGTHPDAQKDLAISFEYTPPQDAGDFGSTSGTIKVDVAKFPVIINADDKSKPFGDKNPELTATIYRAKGPNAGAQTDDDGNPITGLLLGDTPESAFGTQFVLTTDAKQMSPANQEGRLDLNSDGDFADPGEEPTFNGGYRIRFGQEATASNYHLRFNTDLSDGAGDELGKLTVNRRRLVVTAMDQTRPFQQPNPEPVAVFDDPTTDAKNDGFAFGSNVFPDLSATTMIGSAEDGTAKSLLNSQPNLQHTANVSSAVGTYPIIVSEAFGDNFTTTLKNGELTVTKGETTIILGNLNRQFDGNPKEPAVSTDPSFIGEEGLFTITWENIPGPPVEPGSYDFTVTVNDTVSDWGGSRSGTLTIAKQEAGILISNTTQKFDGDPKPVRVQTSPAGLNVNVTYDGEAAVPTQPGQYDVVATVDSPRFKGRATGTLTIEKGRVGILIEGASAVFNGEPHPVSVTTSPENLDPTITYDGSPEAPVNAGTYEVVVSVENELYEGSQTTTLTIKKATADIQVGGTTQVFNGEPREVDVTTTPADLPVTVTYNGQPEAPVDAGTYSVEVRVSENAQNYKGQATANLTVEKAPQEIEFTGVPDEIGLNQMPFSLGVSATSGLEVNLRVLTGPASIENGQLVSTDGTGTVGILAEQGGNENYLRAEDVFRFIELVPEKEPEQVSIGSVSVDNNGTLTLTIQGGQGPFIVETKGSLTQAEWTEVTRSNERTVSLSPDGDIGFFRVRSGE